MVGLAAGTISTLGFFFLSPLLEEKAGLGDTCGVHNLHGIPGLLGGLVRPDDPGTDPPECRRGRSNRLDEYTLRTDIHDIGPEVMHALHRFLTCVAAARRYMNTHPYWDASAQSSLRTGCHSICLVCHSHVTAPPLFRKVAGVSAWGQDASLLSHSTYGATVGWQCLAVLVTLTAASVSGTLAGAIVSTVNPAKQHLGPHQLFDDGAFWTVCGGPRAFVVSLSQSVGTVTIGLATVLICGSFSVFDTGNRKRCNLWHLSAMVSR